MFIAINDSYVTNTHTINVKILIKMYHLISFSLNVYFLIFLEYEKFMTIFFNILTFLATLIKKKHNFGFQSLELKSKWL